MQIVESVESTPDWESREERRCSERRALAGHGLDMDDLASMCERQHRQGPALPEARVPKTRGRSQGDGDGSQPSQAVASCRF